MSLYWLCKAPVTLRQIQRGESSVYVAHQLWTFSNHDCSSCDLHYIFWNEHHSCINIIWPLIWTIKTKTESMHVSYSIQYSYAHRHMYSYVPCATRWPSLQIVQRDTFDVAFDWWTSPYMPASCWNRAFVMLNDGGILEMNWRLLRVPRWLESKQGVYHWGVHCFQEWLPL